MSLHHAVALCMDHCHSAELAGGSDWFKTVVLSGGSACLPGLSGKFPFLFWHFSSLHLSKKIKWNHNTDYPYIIKIFNSTLGFICFREVTEGTSFITSSLYVEWNQSHPSSTRCRYGMVWRKAYWQCELSTNSFKHSHFPCFIGLHFYVDRVQTYWTFV